MAERRHQRVSVETYALFPKSYFLENLATRSDGSILVSAVNHGELWYVPAATDTLPATPVLLDRLAGLPMGIVEASPTSFMSAPSVTPRSNATI